MISRGGKGGKIEKKGAGSMGNARLKPCSSTVVQAFWMEDKHQKKLRAAPTALILVSPLPTLLGSHALAFRVG